MILPGAPIGGEANLMSDTAIVTVVVGVLGFIGVIITLIVNAGICRRPRGDGRGRCSIFK